MATLCPTVQKSLLTSHLTVSLVLDAPMISPNLKTVQGCLQILMKQLQMHALLHCHGMFLYNVPELSVMIYFCRLGVELCMCALLLIDTQACSQSASQAILSRSRAEEKLRMSLGFAHPLCFIYTTLLIKW